MDVGLKRRTAPPDGAQDKTCAEDILVDWLMQMPIGVDPADAARMVLAAVPMPPDETLLQGRLRNLLIEVSRSSGSPSRISAGRPIRRRR